MTGAAPFRKLAASWAGLFCGPAAWAVATQLNYALVPWLCAKGAIAVPWIALGLAAAALIGMLLSWRALLAAKAGSADLPRLARTERFLAGIGILMAILFALVILLQGFAGLVFEGCER
jgi:hypothetical protein